MLKTVLGDISANEVDSVLCHEHICCYSEYLRMMSGADYLDFDLLEEKAVSYLKRLKAKFGLNLFLDCTPINIGRNVELLRRVSEKSGVHIVCSTGFYHGEEPVLLGSPDELLVEHMIRDAKRINAGMIKAAVEAPSLTDFNVKLLNAAALAQKELGLPIVLHTNARNENAPKALEILLGNGVKPESITVGHLSDTEDAEYIISLAKLGCYIGLDRLYGVKDETYINRKTDMILRLCDAGFGDKLLLSHDAAFFNGFDYPMFINEEPRFSYVFEYIAPRLPEDIFRRLIHDNPIAMLGCGAEN